MKAPGVRSEEKPRSDSTAVEDRGLALLHDRRRLATAVLTLVLVVVAIYVLFPAVVGLDDALERFGDATWYWIVLAVVFTIASFVAYVALFRGILGGTTDTELRRRLGIGRSAEDPPEE